MTDPTPRSEAGPGAADLITVLRPQLRIARLTAKESGLAAGRAYLHAIQLQNPQQH